jgi:hypothetical protein
MHVLNEREIAAQDSPDLSAEPILYLADDPCLDIVNLFI